MLILSSFKCLTLHLHFERFPHKIINLNQLLRLHILNSTMHILSYSNRLYSLKDYKSLKY